MRCCVRFTFSSLLFVFGTADLLNGKSTGKVTNKDVLNLSRRFSTTDNRTFQEDLRRVQDDPCKSSVDLSDINNYGFFKSPNHPDPYPNGVSCRFGFSKTDANSPLFNRPSSLAFLRLKTEGSHNSTVSGDIVTVAPTEEGMTSFAGNYQVNGDHGFHALPFVSVPKTAHEFEVTFQADDDGNDTGFLFAYASEIPEYYGFQDEVLHHETKLEAGFEDVGGVGKSPRQDVVTMDFRNQTITSTNPRLRKVAHFGSPGHQGGNIDYGFFMSPNHPYSYGSNKDVLYHIIVPDGKLVAIHALRVKLAEGIFSRDELTLRSEEDGYPAHISGRDPMSHVWVSLDSSEAFARFTSNDGGEWSGFLAAVASVDWYAEE